jgi:hypothetical protein
MSSCLNKRSATRDANTSSRPSPQLGHVAMDAGLDDLILGDLLLLT